VKSKRAAVFLDRDGTLIEHVHYLTDWRKVRIIPGAAEALRRFHEAGFVCVVATNQSVIGRGMLTVEGLEKIHSVMSEKFSEQGVGLDGIYLCPIAPTRQDPLQIEHPDRKPGSGMLLRAARELDLDLSRSWMVGDALTDVLAGRNAGCIGCVLVRTGKGGSVDANHCAVDLVADDLSNAADLILARSEAGSHSEP
jgi:D-glycero-D-manno-heptose 1,7-bisphosphate phosphatase